MIPYRPLVPLLLAAAAACSGGAPEASPRRSAADTTRVEPAVHVDSALPLDEALRRFRAGMPDIPTALRGGAESRDALVTRFARALESRDTATIDQLVLTRAEFAYLYYPTARLRQPPYELDPQMMWYQMSTSSGTGIGRALQRYGGRSLGYLGYDCPHPPKREGANTLWSGCALRRVRAAGDTLHEVLFGSILERDGRFKFVSYANNL
jgi:hypothetical protein